MNAYISSIWLWFYQKKLSQQIGFACGVFLIILSSVIAIQWIFGNSYEILFDRLEPREASELVKQLEQEQVSYQLINQGHTILIAKPLVEKMRLKLVSHQLPLKNNIGFEIFDKSDFGLTDFSQKINYQRALQGELERTIMSLSEVSYARVHLVLPEKHLFQNNHSNAQAAVNLHLKQALSQTQVASIIQLISTSVENLDKKRITVVDQNGNNLARNQDKNLGQFTFKKSSEQYLVNKVQQLLVKIFNTDQLMVNVNIDVDYDKLRREAIKPQATGIISHEKQSRQLTGNKTKNKPNENTNTEKSYTLGQEKEYFTKALGNIKRLTVSVALPKSISLTEKIKIESLIKSTVGFDHHRGDDISIEAVIPDKIATPISLVPTTQRLPYLSYAFLLIVIVFITTLGSVVYRKKMLQKRKQLLLLELNQWLNHHA